MFGVYCSMSATRLQRQARRAPFRFAPRRRRLGLRAADASAPFTLSLATYPQHDPSPLAVLLATLCLILAACVPATANSAEIFPSTVTARLFKPHDSFTRVEFMVRARATRWLFTPRAPL